MGLDASVAGGLPTAVEVTAPEPLGGPVSVSDSLPGDAGNPEGIPPESVPLLERLFLRRVQSGDPRAFRELVRKHQDRVYSLALRMLGDAHEAEDVSQDVFLSAHKHLTRFRGECRISTWLYRVTRNHCLNRLKYLERRETESDSARPEADLAQTEMPLLTQPDRPDRALLGAEERMHVHAALRHLSAEHRLLVVLRDIEGLSYEDIARIAELPAGTVKSRLHRARSALAAHLAAAGMVPDGTPEPASAGPGKGRG